MRRRSLRLAGFDYSSVGWYFITICTARRVSTLGVVESGVVQLSSAGAAAKACLLDIPLHHDGVALDSHVVMPNHVHAVIALGSPGTTLGIVVATYKAAVSRNLGARGLWQRGYYDHVIREDADLERIREYIETNPIRWALDPENRLEGRRGEIYLAPTRYTNVDETTAACELHGKSIQRSVRRQTYSHVTTDGDFS
jgi:REP element-mobilizing transposase RayT